MGVLCAPWVTVADLPEARPALTDEVWNRLCLAASEVLYDLSGRRWRGPCTVEVALIGPPSPGFGFLRWSVTGDLYALGSISDDGLSIQLPDADVTEIIEARVGDTVLDPATYDLRGGHWLDRVGCAGWSSCLPLVLTYRFGRTPPVGGIVAAAAYAVELGKASAGDDTCRLPTLVKSIARQGVTITRLTAVELREARMLGIPEADDWITSVNPNGLRRRSRVWSPDTAPARTYRRTPPTP